MSIIIHATHGLRNVEKMESMNFDKDYCVDYSRNIVKEIEAANERSKDLNSEDDLFSYIGNECLEISVMSTLDGEYKSALILRTFGGPNCYIDTREKHVITYSGTESGTWGLDAEICDYIDDLIKEIWDCRN